MKTLVIYESMYGNTHRVATAIAAGLYAAGEARAELFSEVTDASLDGVELVVVGAPTHVHGLSRASTRRAAATAAGDPEKHLVLEPHTDGDGLREWLDALGIIVARGAAFDTRVDRPAIVTGRASRGIARRLVEHGCDLVAPPESFLVDLRNRLLAGEEERAREWGAGLARLMGAGGGQRVPA